MGQEKWDRLSSEGRLMEVTRFEVSHLTLFQEQGSEPVQPGWGEGEGGHDGVGGGEGEEREVGLGILFSFPNLRFLEML